MCGFRDPAIFEYHPGLAGLISNASGIRFLRIRSSPYADVFLSCLRILIDHVDPLRCEVKTTNLVPLLGRTIRESSSISCLHLALTFAYPFVTDHQLTLAVRMTSAARCSIRRR